MRPGCRIVHVRQAVRVQVHACLPRPGLLVRRPRPVGGRAAGAAPTPAAPDGGTGPLAVPTLRIALVACLRRNVAERPARSRLWPRRSGAKVMRPRAVGLQRRVSPHFLIGCSALDLPVVGLQIAPKGADKGAPQ